MSRSNADQGWLGKPKGLRVNDYMVFGDRAYRIHKTVVHTFSVGDVEDPDIYAAGPIINWQESEMGIWVLDKSVETPEWHRLIDPMSYHYRYAIVAFLKDVDYTFWTLKWGKAV